MNWSENRMSEHLDVRGKTTNNIIQWYYDYALIVNRRYQRKLVWELEEKRLFIDSIINKYPTPSIIISSYEGPDANGKIMDYYEIIDGLQRLNAIVSFVNNEYGILVDGEEYFYDMQFTPTVLTKRLRGELQQREPVLPFDVCQDFSNAEIPVILTTQRENRDKKIEQIFGRINSSGRKLSAHDIRQASSVGEFPDLVRRVATNLRGDFTYYDEVNLCDMPKISLKGCGLNYGVDPDKTFWRRHDIIPFKNFRQSKDEEVIASALAVVLLGKNFRINAENLNALYRPNTENFERITEEIVKIGKDNIELYSKDVVSQIDNIFNSVGSNFTDYLYPKKDAAGKDISFIILFCTIYQLNRESYSVEDYKKVAHALKRQFTSTFDLISQKSNHNNRVQVMETLYNTLKSVMVKHLPKKRTPDEKLLEKLLSLSEIESQMVEFKIGVTYFEDGQLNNKEVTKIMRTLVAMANTNCKNQTEGYVVIGVANNRQSCENWEATYGEAPLTYGSHKIVGVTKEATTHFFNEDKYALKFGELIRKSPISEPLKTYVLSNYRLADFKGKSLMILPSCHQTETSYYGNEYYIREGSRTSHIKEKDKTK